MKLLAGDRALVTGVGNGIGRAGVPFEPRILVGDPAEMIAKHAKSWGCELVCIGSPAAFMGSTATKVLNISQVPVLVVK